MSLFRLIPVLFMTSTASAAAFVGIPDIQYTADTSGNSPYAGQVITTRGVVTAVYAGGFVLQDPSVGLWSGIFIYDPGHRPEAGDSLEITGTVSEYFGLTELMTITGYQILTHGAALPAPASVSTASIATGAPTAESYEGVLVSCPGVRVAAWSSGGDWQVGDATGEVMVSDRGDYLYDPTPGDSLAFVNGVLLYSWDEFRIEPRYEEDIGRLGFTRFALHGTVVTPDQVLSNTYVVVNRRHIEAVTATVPVVPIIETNGVIFPALIDAHNHPIYNIFPELDLGQTFTNRYQWPNDADYIAWRAVYNDLVNQGLSPQMWKYSEARALIGGAGSIQGAFLSSTWDAWADPKCLARNLERFPARVYSTVFPMSLSASSRQNIKNAIAGGVYRATVIHLCEGTDASSLAEFYTWKGWGMLDSTTVIIHGLACGAPEFAQMADVGAALVWSPRSELTLYAATTYIPDAVAAGVSVSLGPDWCVTGSKGMLQELSVADSLNQDAFGGLLSDQDLVEMVTVNPAAAFAREHELGRIAPGYLADFTVVAPGSTPSYRSLIEAKPEDVRLMMVEGRALYGTAPLMDALHPEGGMETIVLCDGLERKIFFRLDDTGVPTSSESLADVTATLSAAYPDLLGLGSCPATGVRPGASPPSPLILRAGPVPFQSELDVYISRAGVGNGAIARVTVYDVAGREIRVLFEGRLPEAGRHVTWDGRDHRGERASSGVYFVRAVVDHEQTSRSVILLR
jgi:5-methylthioadenosine/S-adenosylhomocysteine deaminase